MLTQMLTQKLNHNWVYYNISVYTLPPHTMKIIIRALSLANSNRSGQERGCGKGVTNFLIAALYGMISQ